MTKPQITTAPATLNGKSRFHFVVLLPGGRSSKSLRTWACKRDALAAGKREWRVQ